MWTIADRLRWLLKKYGMTQRELAEKSGLTEAAICRYLKGERIPHSLALAAMAQALGVSMDWLANGETDKGIDEVKTVLLCNAGNLSRDDVFDLVELLMRARASVDS